MDEEFKKIFKEETLEILQELEEELLNLEKDPENEDHIAKIFRGIHTIKGSGAMFGFDQISEFSHGIEDYFSDIREGKSVVKKELIDLCFQGLDYIGKAIEEELDPGIGQSILDQINNLYHLPQNNQEEEVVPEEKGNKVERIFRIIFEPSINIFKSGVKIEKIFDSLRRNGTAVFVARTSGIPDLNNFDPEQCYLSWNIIYKTLLDVNTVKDEFIFIDSDSTVKVSLLDEGSDDDPEYKKLGEILLEKGDVDRKSLDNALKKQTNIGDLLIKSGVQPETIQSAVIEQKLVRQKRKEKNEKMIARSLRVSSSKVDHLVNLVGEMVTLQARISQYSNDQPANVELLTLSEEFERLVWDLRDSTMEIRMIPIGSTFGKFKRLVRDLSTSFGKSVRLQTKGEETELDKTVIEQLGDPLVHIVRNCIDHGIEDPEERKKAGKDPVGTIWLSAYHSGSNVYVDIKDDGRGLDMARIRDKAIQRGLIKADEDWTDDQISKFIFHPGFSTARVVSDVSGRGVGMDVVKRNIESLRGTIDVDTEQGRGTEISLRIPLTLAIIDGLLVKLSGDHYVIPLGLVEECIEIEHREILENSDRAYVNIREEIVPYIYLRDELMIKDRDHPKIEQIVVTREKNKRVGLVVDEVVGEHQTVIKSLSSFYRGVKGVSGATIMGDGRIALILDVSSLVDIIIRRDTINKEK